ncbi:MULTISPECIES: ABC transporter permease [unclassified Mycolicibacterium]|uniref:ABC transporter permease n=1 Tax=unclassified Mycolicibacterium TaxID=2636767 RepID=UPI0012DC0501|nr:MULTISPECIES: ABC transporter permease [unclassified Mycolicibacterium]MUL85930.1 ABC transporter permease [Mycolicibacterium sp. CBMA 329]MUL91698.1 ABC transporter permease [Mycolicibacterium sp. CBMA 331]MUM03149.1 ABC transporter permease [Mycolicibacterium sp. CBMA 334]MUM29535.1 ABC transporter permease [Mycolicibacterium sp. CBMA 295]MUM41993.1 ABC transporter permease [Mycolicibacterium sp. CBMA 247]
MDETTRAGWGLRAWAVLVAVLLVAPLLVVIPISFAAKPSFKFPPDGYSVSWYADLFTDHRWTSAIGTSLLVGLLVTVISTVMGTAAALGIHRRGGRAATVVTGILVAPMIVPGIVSAVAIYSVYLRWSLTGNLQGFLLAHTVLAMPFVVITVLSSLRSTDPVLERAAAILGAGPWRTFVRVTLPGIARGIGSGALFAFVTSFDEVVAASFLQSPAIRTLPIEMFVSVTNEVDPTIAAVSTVILALTTVVALLPLLTRNRKPKGGSD